MLEALFERVGDPDAQFTLEVRRSNQGAFELYERLGFKAAGIRRRYYADNGEDAIVMWRTPATRARLARRRAQRAAAVILALETSCDDTCAAVVTRGGRDPLERRLLPGHPRPLRRRGAGDRLAPPPRAGQRRRRRRAGPRGRHARRRRPVAVTQGPGLVGALLIGVATAKGLAAPRAAAARARRPPAGPRRRQLPRARPDRAAVPVPDRLRRPHAAGPRHRARRLRAARRHARRRRRRGVRQGRAAARARLPRRRRRCPSWPPTATRRRSRSRPRRAWRAWTSPSRA